jgi:hypothetical protein
MTEIEIEQRTILMEHYQNLLKPQQEIFSLQEISTKAI